LPGLLYKLTPAGHKVFMLPAENRWISGNGHIEWLILPGDFSICKFQARPPDIVYFDPFSFKTDRALWTLTAFRELAGVCADRAVELFTLPHGPP
jgi:queuine tRNA-ribosyltransferase